MNMREKLGAGVRVGAWVRKRFGALSSNSNVLAKKLDTACRKAGDLWLGVRGSVLRITGGVVLGSGLWAVYWHYPYPSFLKYHEEIRNLGLLFVAVISIPFLIWRTSVADRQSKASQAQAQVASDNHLADTYTKAIEQLGAEGKGGEPALELRLGAIYALEKLAKTNRDYHPQIMEVFCAYIRLHAPYDPDEETGETEKELVPPREDIQTIFTVIGSRNTEFDTGSIKLGPVDLTRINGRKLNFQRINLVRASLRQANLVGVNLIGAALLGADMDRAILMGAKLQGAMLQGANLHGVTLGGKVSLVGADLRNANVKGIVGADFTGALNVPEKYRTE